MVVLLMAGAFTGMHTRVDLEEYLLCDRNDNLRPLMMHGTAGAGGAGHDRNIGGCPIS